MSSLAGSEDSGIEGGSGVERLVYFSDAVFAIAITLLALEIRLPETQEPSTRELRNALLGLLPQFYGFAISFWIIAVYWLAHHRIFRYIRVDDRRLQVINLLFLMWIVLAPFSASLLGGYGSYQLVEVVYFSHMILTSLSMALLWWYATSDRKLVDPDIDPVVIRYNFARILSTSRLRARHLHLVLQHRSRGILRAPAVLRQARHRPLRQTPPRLMVVGLEGLEVREARVVVSPYEKHVEASGAG